MSEEEAVLSCRAGVFQHSDGNWKQIDGGSSRIWLMKHTVYVSYRVVGCREDNPQEFVLNASVVADIVYQKATSKFVQWKDEEAVYGLNFNTDEEADQFVAEFQIAIDTMANLPEDTPRGTDSPLGSPKLPESPRNLGQNTAPTSNPPPPLSNPPPPSYVPPPLDTPLPPPIPNDVAIPPPIDSPTTRKIKRKNSEKSEKKNGTLKPSKREEFDVAKDSDGKDKDKKDKDKSDSGPSSRDLKRKNSKNLIDAQKVSSSPGESRDALDRKSKRDSTDGGKVKEIKDKDKRKDSDELKRKSTRDSVDVEKRTSKNLDSGASSINNSGELDKKKSSKKDPSKRKSQNLSDSPAISGEFTQASTTPQASSSPKMPGIVEGESIRSKQAKEILSTEISYVASLDKLHEKWIEPMENKKMISEEDSRTLFANIGSIRIFNRNLMENLQQRMKEWDDTKTIIGDIFVQLGPFLKTYKTYCDNYDKAIAVYERIRAKKSLASFFKSAEAACGGFTLPFFLIMPVQRIPRYMLLLRELVNKTPKEHPDYANLHKALTMVAEIAEIVNKSVREAERVRMLENLIKKNFSGIEALMAPHRQLLLEGDLESNVKSAKKDCDYVLLFNDLIAFVGENKSQKVIESTIKFDIAWVKDSSEVSPTSFEVLTPENSIVLTAADVDSKKMWFEEVDKAIKDFLLTTKRNQKDNWLKEDDPETRITKFTFSEGSSYEGEWKGAKMCGKGVYKSKNGSMFDGFFDKGIMFGQGVAKYAGGDVYEGEWRFDVPHGKGKLLTKNGVYEGEWETGRKSGQGTMTWENGDVYVGSWQGDVMHGNGKLSFADGSFYEGEFKEGKRHGTGTFLSYNGSKYEGAWVDDKRSGKAKLTLLSGEVYEGDFVENKKNGDGVWTSATGKEKYDGEWRDDARHGKGTLTGAAGYSYVGNWKESKKYGQGKEILPDGSSYEGTWAANQYEGSGVWIGAEGQKYEGTFHQGKKFGKGVFVDVEGSRYEGDFLHDRKEGKGKIVYKNGCWYQGDWVSDQFHGQGTMVWADGTKYTGDWQNGMRHGNGKYETALGAYEGEWKNDLRDGNGIFKGKDGSVFEGEWKENRKNGKAKYTDAAGNATQQMWRDGIMKTPGIKHFAPELPDHFKLL